ncbi:AT-hook motif nuclear-localized protein 1 isoform X1 [Ricinus communis]|uniref:AT-hook motif nuclear-localized protein 1 isoform X1 n=1 Tax=Ricinus communis TaxID=3988 RepID=UPI000772D041|nr:AT-hook motif nuclear-localized protein 1 isoform X1 [Ricinus communis]|eukprot:XP_002528575.2 AT-hook motif nuclear-localized protein 1 isoform X1 [Ricinus communis]
MEEKESTVSGSPMGSETDSPQPVSSMVAVEPPPQQVMMNINMNMGAPGENVMILERSSNVSATTAASIASSGGSGGGGGGNNNNNSLDLFGKKKRGRPRKYDSEGNLRVQPFNHYQAVSAATGALTSPPPTTPAFSFSPSPPDHGFNSSSKRGRGRPPGSGNWQLLASLGELFANTAGGDFTPHVVTVNTGEDVAGKIHSFAQKGPRGICILSANGAVSNVTIRQPGSSGGILTYEGRFEILSLSGSFTVSENGGVRSRTGGLSVSLASPDGRVIGGGIAGLLLAASPIQIVMGSFMPNGYKVHKKKHHRENTVIRGTQGVVSEASPISQAKPNGETCLISASPVPEQSHGGTENSANDQQIPNATNSLSVCWNGSEPTSDQRPSPDINVSVLNEEDVQGVL